MARMDDVPSQLRQPAWHEQVVDIESMKAEVKEVPDEERLHLA